MDYNIPQELREERNKYEKLKKTIGPLSLVGFIIFIVVGVYMMAKVSKIVGIAFFCLALAAVVVCIIIDKKLKVAQKNMDETQIRIQKTIKEGLLEAIGYSSWKYTDRQDAFVSLKSMQAVNNYDDVKFLKENPERLTRAIAKMKEKENYATALKDLMQDNPYKDSEFYGDFYNEMINSLSCTNAYFVVVSYVSPAGRKSANTTLTISQNRLQTLITNKSILMSKSEYSRYLKEESKEQLENKQHEFYERINKIIDVVNEWKEKLVIKSDADRLDQIIADVFDRTINSIKKIKTLDSDEWDVLDKYLAGVEKQIVAILQMNHNILKYYKSEDFLKIKTTCSTLMNSQREFNEYIDEKVKSISSLFGTNIVRNETINEDEYNYIHPYKKSITPFTAEVSANVFASAENKPLEYIIKYFYPNKAMYPKQIQNLQTLIAELETLKEAKQIIENRKAEVKQYISNVPPYIMKNDKDGFYSRLGFATINENTLTVEYKFAYTSNGGKAQRSFTVPMTEETIISLIQALENKLTMSTFSKEQRSLMTAKLRQTIKERDNFTCKYCGNSIYKEPNLLLEIDHIIPVAKGGCTEEKNLQTLCWKCNRSKGAKI